MSNFVIAIRYLDIGVTLMRRDPQTGTLNYVASSGIAVERQKQLETGALPAGVYVVIPTSTGCKVAQNREDAAEDDDELDEIIDDEDEEQQVIN
jgi:hypothetical protein